MNYWLIYLLFLNATPIIIGNGYDWQINIVYAHLFSLKILATPPIIIVNRHDWRQLATLTKWEGQTAESAAHEGRSQRCFSVVVVWAVRLKTDMINNWIVLSDWVFLFFGWFTIFSVKFEFIIVYIFGLVGRFLPNARVSRLESSRKTKAAGNGLYAIGRWCRFDSNYFSGKKH